MDIGIIATGAIVIGGIMVGVITAICTTATGGITVPGASATTAIVTITIGPMFGRHIVPFIAIALTPTASACAGGSWRVNA
jgi:hypothetical protein